MVLILDASYTMHKDLLKDKIAAVEAQMKAKLDEFRRTFAQAGDKGTGVEDVFRSFLRQYLPRRLEVGVGEVIDTKGKRSRQTDIVIVNEDHPITFVQNLPGLFFIEGVCAAGEAKTILTSKELGRTIDNSFDFKKLEINPGENTTASSNPSDLNRFYKCPPYFLIAFSSQLRFPSILMRIANSLKQKGFAVNEINTVVDGIFIIDQGWAINFGDGLGCFQSVTDEGAPVKGWAWKNSNAVLFDLLAWLSAVMPRMIRYEPILPFYMLPRRT